MGSWTRNYWQNAEAIDLSSNVKFGEMTSSARSPFELQSQSAIIVNPGPQFAGDDIADNISTTSTIAVGGSVSSAIQSDGDLDYFRISLTAGQTYTFSLTGLSDSYVELRDASGNSIVGGENDDGGIQLDSFLMYRADTSGTFYVVARHFSPVVTDNYPVVTGNYTLSVDTIARGETSPTTFVNNGLTHFSYDEAAIQISREGYSWAQSFGTSATVTYAFRSSAPASMPDDTQGFSRFSAAQITAAESALAAWAAVANITFVRANDGDGYSNNAAILFGNYSTGSAGAAAFAFNPFSGNQSASSTQGDIWINSSLAYNATPVRGDYGQQVLLHEIGHALGLNHPGDYNASANGTISYVPDADYYADSRMFTAMSYFSGGNTGANTTLYASLPQLHDIAAIQRLYGANITTRTGDTIYGFNSNTGVPEYTLSLTGQAAIFTVWDGGGVDTLDFSGYTTNSVIDLRAEAFSNVGPSINNGGSLSIANVSIARGSVIENAIGGSGDDTITGNASNNVLTGGAGSDQLIGNDGNDTLSGGTGSDQMIGGAGDDTYFADALDTITEDVGNGIDTVVSTQTFTLGANLENLTLSGAGGPTNGTGNELNNVITGDAGANTLSGLAGNDTLIGGLGADTLIGGIGDDTYEVDNAGDVVTEALSEGTDTVRTFIADYVLGANVENLILMGSLVVGTGNELYNVITGNAQNNLLFGGIGNDTLIGGAGHDHLYGGVGVDVLDGGDGYDYARYDNAGARVIADTVLGGAGGEGAGDTFFSIEGLVGSSFNDFLSGGDVANDIHGMGGNDVIQGRGGNDYLGGEDGADHLYGGAGIDVLDGGTGYDYARYDDATGRVVADTVLGGAGGDGAGDTFISIEGLVGSAFNDFLSGGDIENDIHGLAGNDVIQGRGGNDNLGGEDGADHLFGGAGADTLDGGAGFDYVRYDDSPGAVTVNLATGGTGSDAQGDVFISIEGVLGSAFNDTLTGTNEINDMYGGAGADTMFGLGGGDALTGDAGADRLNGGAGADILTGGDDADTFVFVAGQANGDTVVDFSLSGGDLLEFSGYGTAAQGATFVQLDATHWQITSSNGLIVETLTIANGVVFDSSDYVFGP